MNAKVLQFPISVATRDTVAAVHSAMQLHAQISKAPPVPAIERPRLSLVPLGCRKCGDSECKADPKLQDFLRITSAADVEKGYADPIAYAAWKAYEVHGVSCVARQFARMQMIPIGTVRPRDDGKWDEWTTAGWMLADVVKIFVAVEGEYRDVLFKIVPHGGRYIARAVPGQGLTEDETEHHEQAALTQWGLERSL